MNIRVEHTNIEVEADDLEHAKELALKHAKDNSDKFCWKRCGDFDHNYQTEDCTEI